MESFDLAVGDIAEFLDVDVNQRAQVGVLVVGWVSKQLHAATGDLRRSTTRYSVASQWFDQPAPG